MMDQCAAGWSLKETDHFFRVMWQGRSYPSFPKKRDIAVGHIRSMIRHLGIDIVCAKKHINVL